MRWIAAILAFLMGMAAVAQTPAGQQRAFEVVSIKQAIFPNDAYFAGYSSAGPCAPGGLVISGNRVTLRQASVCGLIALAYDFRDYMVIGGPDWMRKTDKSLYYEIQATAPATSTPLTPPLAHEMLQTLLADRFGLKVHKETKELPIYALVVGKNGPKLTLDSDGPCAKAARNGRNPSIIGGPGLMASCMPATMAQLADRLSRNADRPVIDRTGIDGGHTFELQWDAGGRANQSDTPSLFTAIQEQLGLRLEATKAPIDVLMIDSISRPTEN